MIKNFMLNTQFETHKYPSLYKVRDSKDLILRLGLDNKLEIHNGCVNTISWSDDDCNLILSGSDDQNLVITDAFSGKNKATIRSNHKANILCAKFMPKTNSEKLISCAADGSLFLTDINKTQYTNQKNKFECHGDKACYEICNYVQDSQSFATCGQDGCVKLFDLRTTAKCEKMFCQEHTLIKLSTGISAMAINPYIPYHLVCAGLDGVVRFYDRRSMSVGSSESKHTSQSTHGLFACFSVTNNSGANSNENCGTVVSNKRVTSLQYDNWGNDLLVSYQSDNIYLLDWRDLSMENKNDINDWNDSTELGSPTEPQSPTQTSPQSRKFRISTDWSDTGPTSMPINETIDNNDPRSFLLRRLNDWFSDFYQSRSANIRTEQTNLRNINQQEEPILEPTQTTFNNFNDKEDENMNEDYDDNKSKKRDSSDSGEESTNAEDRQNREEDSISNKAQRSSLTSYLIGSRFKMKQAMKLENNVIKNKPSPKIKQIYTGHRNARTMIKQCNFWGNDHVISGSDCGHIFAWNKKSGRIVNIIEADKHVVNCVQENPLYPVLASSGIDYDLKIWQPVLEDPVDINAKVDILTKRNKLMLNEIKNTIFIPVQFMVPALRLFGANIRNATNRNRTRTDQSNAE